MWKKYVRARQPTGDTIWPRKYEIYMSDNKGEDTHTHL